MVASVLILKEVLNVNVASLENSILQGEIVLMKNQVHVIVSKVVTSENAEPKML